tara:strand:- start:58 stop:288 length:231 start_codon:yes stop_codon:yes gene_type:complete
MTDKKEKEPGRKWDGKSRPSNDIYKKNWNRIFGSVNFQEEGDFIFCSRCKDNTIHKPTFGKCMKCGLEEYNENTSN